MQSCEDYKREFLEGLQPYEILFLTAPGNSTVWEGRDNVWEVIFFIYIAVFAALFLALGVIATLLLIKKDCMRLKTKLFFAIYSCIAILGFSKAAWLVLDPFGLIGFIQDYFPGWFIISRLIEALGFPSLVASYTLMIATLLKISTKPGCQWYHKWKMTIPLLLIPFLIVYAAETIALTVQYPGVIVVVVCELFFTVWGITMCVLFLFAGNRLLRKLKRRQLKSIRVSDVHLNGNNQAEIATRRQFVSDEQRRHGNKVRRTNQKITLITYGTVLVAFPYSLVTASRAVITCLVLYYSCFGEEGRRGSSVAWLVLEIMQRVAELVLGLVLLYSVTDMSLVKGIFCSRRATQNTP